MPIYEFECPGCSWLMEQLLPHSEADASTPCPECGSAMKRLFSSPSVGPSSPEKFFQPSPNARDSVKERHRKEVIGMNKDSAKQYQRMKKQQGA